MNKKIKKLKDQARDYYLSQEDLDCSVKELHELVEQKFAELIIEECVKACQREWYDLNNNHPNETDPRMIGIHVGQKNGVLKSIERIKKEFKFKNKELDRQDLKDIRSNLGYSRVGRNNV